MNTMPNAQNSFPIALLYFFTLFTSNIFALAQNPSGCGFFVKTAWLPIPTNNTNIAHQIINASTFSVIIKPSEPPISANVSDRMYSKYIGTSCYETGKRFGVPILGTMAHSHIMKYDTEYEAFLAYAKCFPNNSTFLVDTYDTLKSGVPNAIRVAKDFLIPNGYTLKGIRLDSGDLAYLSKECRRILDENDSLKFKGKFILKGIV